MTFVDVGADPIDLSEIPPPDISVENLGQYERDMGSGYEAWFRAQVASMFAGIDTWFETPAETAHNAWVVVNDIKSGRDPSWQGNKGADIKAIAADPGVRQYIFQKYVGRLNAADVARQSFMHQVMERQINALAYAVNRNATALTNMHKIIVEYVDTRVAGEKNARIAGDDGVIKLAKALDAQVVSGMEAWTTSHVAAPLLKTIDTVHAQTLTQAGNLVSADHANILKELLPSIAGILATQTAMQKIMAAQQTEIDTCLQPMCDTMGPNTELGKGLSLLKGIKWLAILAALEAMDVKTLEALANTVAGTEGAIGDWVGTKILDELEGQ